MNYESFFAAVDGDGIEVHFDNPRETPTTRLSNEALFHLPLLAVTVLMLAKGRRKPRSSELGQLIGECFERTFAGFKGSSQHLGWSANLRVRTVRALTFLETAGLVAVESNTRRLSATGRGRAVIDTALRQESELSLVLLTVEREYRNISEEKQISLVFE
jgi:hypothetical protein